MKRWLGVAMVVALAAIAAAESGDAERFRKATGVLTTMASGSDAVIPRDLLGQARAVAVFSGVTKGAIIVGGHHGDGVGTDGRFTAEIFSYAKATGFFAGVSSRAAT
jgi:lipid-binding SYLF domain-containing protein